MIWVHAVSVGEVLAVAGLVEELQRRFPRQRIFISTTTDTGQALARKRLVKRMCFIFRWISGLRFGLTCGLCGREMVVIAETEFWPNFMRLAHESGARIAVVNARISDRSWPSYRRFRGLLRRVLANVDLFLAQTAEDAARLRDIGAPPERVRVSGKFEVRYSGAGCACDCGEPAKAIAAERCRAGAGLRQHRGWRRAAAAEGV